MGDEKSCWFCRNVNGNNVIYNDGIFYSQLDAYPITPGHTEVVPVRHVVSLADLTHEEWDALRPAIENTMGVLKSIDLSAYYKRWVEKPIDENSKRFCEDILKHIGMGKVPDAYNHGINDGLAAGRTVHHLHWHIIPRFLGDIEDPRGGIRHMIPGKGNYKK